MRPSTNCAEDGGQAHPRKSSDTDETLRRRAAAPPPEGRGSRQLDQAPVTDDYPFERPWTLVDATIDRVIVDVSGEPYLDLETEALTMMSRD
jgi:hypothetical protein